MKILEFGEGHKLVIQEAQQTPEDKTKQNYTYPYHHQSAKYKRYREKREGS